MKKRNKKKYGIFNFEPISKIAPEFHVMTFFKTKHLISVFKFKYFLPADLRQLLRIDHN